MKVFDNTQNVYNAVDSVIDNGVAILEGTKTPAVKYANRIIKCLKPYKDISPQIGYKNVLNNGYFYYVHDMNKFPMGSKELDQIIDKVDERYA